MYYLHKTFLTLHVIVGFASLFVFWLPVAARKGGALHRRAGRWFELVMLAVAGSAFVLALATLVDPIGVRAIEIEPTPERSAEIARRGRSAASFLLMLSLLVFVSVRQGVMAVRHKLDRAPLRHWSYVGPVVLLLAVALPVGVLGLAGSQTLLVIFAVLSIVASTGLLRYVYRETVGPKQWLAEHFGGFIGAGIGAYTAFFAFGGARFMAELLPGQWQILPWVTPAIIGIFAIRRLERRHVGRVLRVASECSAVGAASSRERR